MHLGVVKDTAALVAGIVALFKGVYVGPRTHLQALLSCPLDKAGRGERDRDLKESVVL